MQVFPLLQGKMGQGTPGDVPACGEQLAEDELALGSFLKAQCVVLRSLFSLQGLLSQGQFLKGSCLSGTKINSQPFRLRFLMHIHQGKHWQLTGYRSSSKPDTYNKCLN